MECSDVFFVVVVNNLSLCSVSMASYLSSFWTESFVFAF